MSLTRRAFTLAAGSAVALTVLGCEREEAEPAPAAGAGGANGEGGRPNPNRANLATEPFLVGPPEAYAAAAVYDAFKPEMGVWLVSDGRALVALSATCTHTGCTTHWDADAARFTCPCHRSRFDSRGYQQEGSKAKRPLERCALALVSDEAGRPQVRVDPTRRFREERGEWADPASELSLAV